VVPSSHFFGRSFLDRASHDGRQLSRRVLGIVVEDRGRRRQSEFLETWGGRVMRRWVRECRTQVKKWACRGRGNTCRYYMVVDKVCVHQQGKGGRVWLGRRDERRWVEETAGVGSVSLPSREIPRYHTHVFM